MSASLVGSEMCIRDSAREAAGGARGGAQRSVQAGYALPGGGRRPDPQPPVSYTHLTLPTICSV
eukprot:13120875-Alexandrium_andersonii.AAC.1